MSDVVKRYIHEALVLCDYTYQWRLIDAFGRKVNKALFDFTALPTDDTTLDPTEWLNVPVEFGAGDSTAFLGTTVSGDLLITTAGNENDGANLQVKGEAFVQAASRTLYFGCKLQLLDATESDLIVGLCITDATLFAGMTDGIFFRSVDASTDIATVTNVGSAETENLAVGTLVNATDITLEFWSDDASTTYFYIDGTLVATHTAGQTAEILTPSISYLNGALGVDTVTVDWLRTIQVSA